MPALVAVNPACLATDRADAGSAEDGDPFARSAVAAPEDPKDLCAVADSNLDLAAKAILAAPRPAPAAAASAPWNHRSKPARLADVTQRFALQPAEIAALSKNGFVVPARLTLGTYAGAFHEIYQSEMPLYVSVDAVLHAVYRGHDEILARLEERRLAPMLDRTLALMHCALPGAAAAYPEETVRDLDVYLTVARALLSDKGITPAYNEGAATARGLLAQARAATEMATVDLFGRDRKIDFTAFTPRGHYAAEEHAGLAPYFRAAMWLSRVELNLVSRSSRSSAATQAADPRETPREAIFALALADLAERAGASEGVRAMERAWAAFGGKREDVSLAELAELRAGAAIGDLKDPGAFTRLKDVIGERFQRTTRLHFMPEGTTTLPVITTFLGARVVADATALMPLVEPETPGRHVVHAADVAYALGQDRAQRYLTADLGQYPSFQASLDKARRLAHAPPAAEDLHGLWLTAVTALAARPAGALPSFMGSEAFADLRLGSAITAFGQIRHNSVLFAGQSYDQGGCEIPDGYVEPAPAVYQALVAYADQGAAAAASLDPGDEVHARTYFAGLARVLRVLDAIVAGELSGRPLSEEERRWLSMILEMKPGSSGGGPTYTGWWFDLFPTRIDALARADFIADYYTSGEVGTVAYAGARPPALGVFVVDTGGPPRVVVGPVARGYEHQGRLEKRLDDEAAAKLEAVSDPWSASYTVPAPPTPEISLSFGDSNEAMVTAPRPVGAVTVSLLDHHRRPIASITKTVGAGTTAFAFKPATEARPVEAIHLHAGAFDAWSETGGADATRLDFTRPPP
jgi:hypothetical protein